MPVRTRLAQWIFGDRIGLTLFLGGLLFCGTFWQARFFLSDSWTFGNGLLAVAEGHLYLERFPYGSYIGPLPEGASPGTYIHNDRIYARSYGYLYLALPLLWFYQAGARVVDVAVLLPGLWSLTLIASGIQLDRMRNARGWLAPTVSVLAVVLFGLNVWQSQPIAPSRLPILALQSVTILATALTAVFLYRLIALTGDRRTAVLIGAAGVFATPVSFWGPIAKRHAMTVLLVVLVVYAFARSWHARTDTYGRRWRMVAYFWPGLLASINPLEATVVAGSLGIVDILTRRPERLLDWLAPAFALLLGAVPFFLTNALISGNPVVPPDALQNYQSMATGLSTDVSVGAGPRVAVPPARKVDLVALLTGGLLDGSPIVDRIGRAMTRGIQAVLADPWLLVQTIIHDGWPFGTTAKETGNLAVLGGAPVLGALLAVPVIVARSGWRRLVAAPAGAVDLLAGTLVIGFSAFLFPPPPNEAQITTRYLLPIVPLLCYLVARIPAVRAVVNDQGRLIRWGYSIGMLIGSQVLLVTLSLFVSDRAGALEAHGLVNLLLAVTFGGWTLDAIRREQGRWGRRFGAVVLGVTLAVGTLFVLFASWNHMARGEFVVPIFRVLARVIPP